MNQMVAAERPRGKRSEERLARWLAVGAAVALIALAAAIDIELRLAPASGAGGSSLTQVDRSTDDVAPVEDATRVDDRADVQLRTPTLDSFRRPVPE